MGEKKLNTLSILDYLQLEEQAVEKSEYHNGQLVNMSGGTISHGIIGANINAQINAQINASINKNGKDCIPMSSDVKIYIESVNHFVYSDGFVVCGDIESAEKDKNSVVNPKLVIEVLSDSTERYDRGDKFHKYCSLPSFTEYVLINQHYPIVDTIFRQEKQLWSMRTTIGLDKSIYLHAIDAAIPLESIYKNVPNLKAPPFRLNF